MHVFATRFGVSTFGKFRGATELCTTATHSGN